MNLLKWAVALVLVLAATAVFALKPAKVPDAVLKAGQDVQTVFKGLCPREPAPMLCVVGVHISGQYGMLLLFNERGVLVQVLRLNEDGTESLLWTHPEYGV
jgi:hypothetical protein